MFLHKIAGSLIKTSDHPSTAVTQKENGPGNKKQTGHL